MDTKTFQNDYNDTDISARVPLVDRKPGEKARTFRQAFITCKDEETAGHLRDELRETKLNGAPLHVEEYDDTHELFTEVKITGIPSECDIKFVGEICKDSDVISCGVPSNQRGPKLYAFVTLKSNEAAENFIRKLDEQEYTFHVNDGKEDKDAVLHVTRKSRPEERFKQLVIKKIPGTYHSPKEAHNALQNSLNQMNLEDCYKPWLQVEKKRHSGGYHAIASFSEHNHALKYMNACKLAKKRSDEPESLPTVQRRLEPKETSREIYFTRTDPPFKDDELQNFWKTFTDVTCFYLTNINDKPTVAVIKCSNRKTANDIMRFHQREPSNGCWPNGAKIQSRFTYREQRRLRTLFVEWDDGEDEPDLVNLFKDYNVQRTTKRSGKNSAYVELLDKNLAKKAEQEVKLQGTVTKISLEESRNERVSYILSFNGINWWTEQDAN